MVEGWMPRDATYAVRPANITVIDPKSQLRRLVVSGCSQTKMIELVMWGLGAVATG